MAVAVPLLIAASGPGMAAAAAWTAVAFQVTGVNDKINGAASQVFGKDMVNVANIAGMAYGAYQSMSVPDSAGTLSEAAAPAAEVAPEVVPEVATTSPVTQGVAEPVNLADLSGAGATVANPMAADPAALAANSASPSGFTLNTPSADALPSVPTAVDVPVLKASTTSLPTAAAPTPGMGSGNGVGSYYGSGSVGGPPVPAVANVDVPGQGLLAKLQAGAGKLMDSQYTPLMVGGVLQGAGSAYSAAQQRAMAQEQFDREWDRRERLSNLGTAGWRQA